MFKKSGWIGLGLVACSFSVQAEDMQIIVKYKKAPQTMVAMHTQLARLSGAEVTSIKPMAGGAYVVQFNSEKTAGLVSSDTILKRLQKNNNVAYALKDRKGYFKPLPKMEGTLFDSLLSHDSQWDEFSRPAGIMLESAPGLRDGAWAYTTGYSKKPVVVAVLDTGVALNDSLVENLVKDDEGNIWGWNFAGNDNDISDETGSYHGTHVSGTIAGYGNVMTGVGEDLKVLTVKIPDASGMFYESAVINGIYWAVGAEVPGVPKNPYPAKVLNMSFGVDAGPGREIDYCGEALQDAISYARNKGAVIVVAAGNDNVWEHYNAPGVCNGTVKVASTGPEGLRAYYSNYGPGVMLAAPGGDLRYGTKGGILSTVHPEGGYQHSGFAFYQGTSMASPHVAGVAGLIHAISDTPMSAQKVEQLLYVTTHDFGQTNDPKYSCVGKRPCGHGILDAENAVKTALTGFDVLFSAPVLHPLKNQLCGKGMIKVDKRVVTNNGVTWTLEQADCIADDQLQHPKMRQDEKGQVYAEYGPVRYKLQQSGYKQCEIVGYDGIGCFY